MAAEKEVAAREKEVEKRLVEVRQRAEQANRQLEQAQPMLQQLQEVANQVSALESRYRAARLLLSVWLRREKIAGMVANRKVYSAAAVNCAAPLKSLKVSER